MMNESEFKPEPERMIHEVEALKVYFDPVRIRLMQAMAEQPCTVHMLAEATRIPFTRLYYHIHQLEKYGFIRVVRRRAGAGAIEEKFYQITAYNFVVDREMMRLGTPQGEAGFEAVQDAVFEASKVEVRRSLQAGLIDENEIPPHPRALMARRGVYWLKDADASELHARLIALLVEFGQRQFPAEEGHYYNLALILFPMALDLEETDGSTAASDT